MSEAIKIALIEDHSELRENLAFFLKRQGFDVVLESDGRGVLEQLAVVNPDIVILDLGLPESDGLEVADELRLKAPQVRIVMLTARGAKEDRFLGWQGGADAYLVKPVEFLEVDAVIRSLERRMSQNNDKTLSNPAPVWLLSVVQQQLISPNDVLVGLTGREVELLQVLSKKSPSPASKEDLLLVLQGVDYFDSRKLEVSISRLRLKIKEATGESVIKSVRGRGYRFVRELREKES